MKGEDLDGYVAWYEALALEASYTRDDPLCLRKFTDSLCHETTARAARPERWFLVMLVLLASNVRVFRGYRRGSLEGFATLPRMKGQRGSVRGEAC